MEGWGAASRAKSIVDGAGGAMAMVQLYLVPGRVGNDMMML